MPSTAYRALGVGVGQYGATYFNTATARTGRWSAIAGGSAGATFSNLVVDNWDGDNPIAMSLAAGQVIYGRFTEITLSAGSVIAYK